MMSNTNDASMVTKPAAVRAVVLLEKAPTEVGELLELVIPGVSAQLEGAPKDQLTIDINDVPLTFMAGTTPLVAQELDYAVSQSLLRERVQAAVARHAGYVVLSAAVNDDVFTASNVLANIAARYADDDNGLAVWLPDADHATTDVMYAGEVDQRPAQVWFNTMAAQIDASTSLAHTIGVRHLGGVDVQLRATSATPAQAHSALRDAVATMLEASTLPAPGMVVEIGSVPHILTPAQSMIGMGEVLDATPTDQPVTASDGSNEAPADPPKRKGWFGRG